MIEKLKEAYEIIKAAIQSAEGEKAVVMKKVDEEQRLVLGVVLEPDAFDLHNDIYSIEEVAKACQNFNTFCMQGNVEHIINVGADSLAITKSFILPVEAMIGEQPVKAGSWVMEMKVANDTLWDMVKSGDFTGFSIGGKASVEDIEDDE